MTTKFRKLLPTEVKDGPEKIGFSGFDSSITDEKIRDVFETIGPLTALNIVRNNDSEVWGTLSYEDRNMATKALKVYDGFEVEGSIIKLWSCDYEEETKKKRKKSEPSKPQKKADVVDEELKKIMARDAENKIARELYITNIPDQYEPEDLRSFLGEAMQQAKLTKYPGNPVLNLRVNQRFCSLEVRTIEEATQALCLTNIMYKGCSLQVSRQKTASGSNTGKTWEDVRGSCTLGIAETTEAKYDAIAQALRPITNELSSLIPMAFSQYQQSMTPYVEINNILTYEFVEDMDVFEWVQNDIKQEAEKYGPIQELFVPTRQDLGKVLLKFEKDMDAARFLSKLPELSYFGRLIGGTFISPHRFNLIRDRNNLD